MGRAVKVLTERGKLVPHHWARQALITIHPSAILRAPDEALKAAQYQAFVEDLRMIPQALNGSLPAETVKLKRKRDPKWRLDY